KRSRGRNVDRVDFAPSASPGPTQEYIERRCPQTHTRAWCWLCLNAHHCQSYAGTSMRAEPNPQPAGNVRSSHQSKYVHSKDNGPGIQPTGRRSTQTGTMSMGCWERIPPENVCLQNL